jgi:hypothetical protein
MNQQGRAIQKIIFGVYLTQWAIRHKFQRIIFYK